MDVVTSKQHYKEVKSIIKLVAGGIKRKESTYDEHRETRIRSFANYKDLIKVNNSIYSISGHAAKRRLGHKLRKKCPRPEKIEDFQQMFFRLAVNEIILGDIKPDELYDMKNLMHFEDTINAEDIELYSNQSRLVIRKNNLFRFKKKLEKLNRLKAESIDAPNNNSKNTGYSHLNKKSTYAEDSDLNQKLYHEFRNNLKNICIKNQKSLSKVSKSYDIDYLLFLAELGILDKEQLELVMGYLSYYVDTINETLKDFMKNKMEELSGDESALVSNDDTDNSSTNEEYASTDDDEDTSSDTDIEKEDKNDYKQMSEMDEKDEDFNDGGLIDRTLSEAVEQLDQKKREILESMRKVSKICLLIITSFNDEANLVNMNLDFNKDKEKSEEEFTEQTRKEYFFESKIMMKRIVNVIMKILAYLNENKMDGESFFELTVNDPDFYGSINRIFMSVLSIRNDPVVKSHEPIKKFIINEEETLDDIVKGADEEFGEKREKIVKLFSVMVNGQGVSSGVDIHSEAVFDPQNIAGIVKIFKELNNEFQKVERNAKGKDNKAKLNLLRFKLTLLNFPSIILHIIHVVIELHFESTHPSRMRDELSGNLNCILRDGAHLFERILINNNFAQSVLFQKKTSYIYWILVDYDPIRFLGIFENIFSKDSSIIFKNEYAYMMVFKKFKAMIDQNLGGIDEESRVSCEKMAVIYMINSIVERILIRNSDNSEERCFIAHIHEFYGKIMREKVKEYFSLTRDNFQFLTDSYKHVLIGRKFKSIADNKTELLHEDNYDSIKAELHYSMLKLFNESTENWKQFKMTTAPSDTSLFELLNPHIIPMKDHEDDEDGLGEEFEGRRTGDQVFMEKGCDPKGPELKIRTIRFDYTIKYCAKFITELLRLYCNESIFEFNSDIIKMSSSVKLNYSKMLSIQIKYLISLGRQLRKSPDEKYAKEYKDFWLRGLLKIIYKFIKGVYYEISTVKYHECGIGDVLDSLKANLERISDDLEKAKNHIESITKFVNSYNNQEQFNPSRNDTNFTSKQVRELKEKQLSNILLAIENTYKVYKKYNIIEEIDRETHDDLQNGHTELFKSINILGSPYMKKIQEDIIVIKERKKEYDDPNYVSEKLKMINNRVYDSIHPGNNALEMSDEYSGEKEMCPLLSYYINTKENFLQIESNNFFITMDDGGDDGMDSQYYYTLLIKWIIEVFYKKMRPDRIHVYQQENENLSEMDYESHPDRNVNKILKEFDVYSWIQILDNLLVVKPKIRSIMFEKFFSESYSLKKKITDKDNLKETITLNFVRDDLEYRTEEGIAGIFSKAHLIPAAGNNIMDHEKYRPHLENFDLVKNSMVEFRDEKKHSGKQSEDVFKTKVSKVLRADVFIASIFETTFYLQRCIRSEVFNRSFAINMEYYISLSSLIKSLAERNYQNFKEHVGRLKKVHYHRESGMEVFEDSTKKRSSRGRRGTGILKIDKTKLTKNYLDLYYKGLHLYSNVPDKFNELVRKDRPHMFWYNIVTLDTLSEYFNGPCIYNQENCLSNFIKLFLFIKRINKNPYNTFYKLQEKIITLVQTLFEGESKLKCKIMINYLKPVEFYSMIVSHIRLVKEEFIDEKKKRDKIRNRRKNMNQIESNAVIEADLKSEEKEQNLSKKKRKNDYINQILMKAFKLDEEFRDHPIVEISMGLFIIMKTVSNSSSENNFSKFLSEKSIEMATELDAVKHLELTQSDKSKIEHKNKMKVFRALNLLNIKFPFKMKRWRKAVKAESQQNDEQMIKDQKLAESEKIRRENLNFFFFINQITLSIEVLNNERKPCVVFFKKHPECTFLTKETKTKFLEECVIDDAPSKLLDLMQKFNSFQIEMNSNLELYVWLKSWSDFTNESTFKKCMYVTYCISIIININVLLGYRWSSPAADTNLDNFGCDEPFRSIIQVFSWALITISGIFVLIWLRCKYKFAREMAADSLKSQPQYKEKIHRDTFIYKFKKNFVYGFLLQSIPSMLLCHISFALVSLFTRNPIFDSLHLLLLFYLSQTTRYVVNSIVGQFDQVVVTFVIGVCVIYTFTVIHAMYFRTAWDDMTSGGIDMCQTLFGCFGYILDFGFRNGGGIADSFSTLPYEGYYGGSTYWWKIIVNMVFFILVSKFALDIIFGIIIDTFTEMRDSQQARSKSPTLTQF